MAQYRIRRSRLGVNVINLVNSVILKIFFTMKILKSMKKKILLTTEPQKSQRIFFFIQSWDGDWIKESIPMGILNANILCFCPNWAWCNMICRRLPTNHKNILLCVFFAADPSENSGTFRKSDKEKTESFYDKRLLLPLGHVVFNQSVSPDWLKEKNSLGTLCLEQSGW